MNLVIVESAAKAKTINKYLGDKFKVIASIGHIRDINKKKGIDVDNNYQMNYELIDRDHNKPQQIIRDIKNALKTAKKLYLATDQDREGEVIAWHLIDILEKEKTLRNMLKPNTWKELEGMLECAGFKTAQPFWRNHMFVGAIAIK